VVGTSAHHIKLSNQQSRRISSAGGLI